ncbi:MAG: dihydroorotate dehydrogenase-like protein, partial [Betaproteobacteria bacterium]|nr:dihydroorotate dehydrogenase-like protein [Betaproteobacteria bacterium]
SSHLPARQDYESKLDRYLAQIRYLKNRLDIPVIASLNGDSLSGWVELGRELEAAGADALELNTWHLPGSPCETGSGVEDRYIALLSELKAVVGIPICLKLSPFFSALPNFVRRAEKAGAAGVSLFNRFFQPDIDLDTLTVVDRVQLSTSADGLLAMRWIAILRGHTQITLAASGGVHTAGDVLKMLLAGADVTHVASSVLVNGSARIAQMLDDLQHWLSEREYDSVAQLKGSMSQRNHPNPSAFARSAYLNAIDTFTPPAGVRY